ncbi:MAG: MBL fold metallo-hydrolase [Clostridia bacterium]|nr:MBL fold metallo-hydrolase [Clostridia bacterium]
MKISFLGAAETVTGSNHLVEAAGKKFLVDCGMYQGKIVEEYDNSSPFLFDINTIDFMLLTHAHIDHSGRIPKLYNEGYRNPIYATKATCDLCKIMLPDSGHIQETEIEWKNRKRLREGKDPLPPLYTAEEAEKCLEIFKAINYDEIIEIDDNISVRFNDAGHMLGSAIIEIWITEDGKTTKVVFTGDIGNNDLPLLDSPTMISSSDYVIMESTYGNRLHVRNDNKAEAFLDIVSETLDNAGTVVIPSFAVGRTQEILYEIDKLKDEKGANDEAFFKKYKKLMNANVYVDSPLAISATEIFKNNTELFEDEIQEKIKSGDNPLEFPGLHFTVSAEESKELNEMNEPCIILSASGMCDVGRIKHHLKHNLWKETSTILFVGYQVPGTLGRSIIDGAKKVKIFGEEIAVNARIEYIEGYSGHADQEWLLNFVYSFTNKQPKHIFLVHGEKESQEALKQEIEKNAEIKVTIPSFGETYVLDGTDSPKCEENRESIVYYEKLSRKFEVLDNIENLIEKISDIETDIIDEKIETDDEDIITLSNRINELQEHIRKIMNKD